jgi:hypothetical protein
MADWGLGSYVLTIVFLLFLFHERLFDWWLKQKIRGLIGFDRICRLADIGEKDLVFNIEGTSTFSKVNGMKGRDFRVTFLYAAPMSLNTGTRKYPAHHVVGQMFFDTFTDCTKIEEEIASSILEVKEKYRNEIALA